MKSTYLLGLGLFSWLAPLASIAWSDDSIVTWDRHSILIDGKRLFIQAGEFHPWRLPVVSQWTDIMQKFAAAGLNTVSIYVHWGLVNPLDGRTDWSGFRSLQPLFDAARSAGLFVIVRPGPYINAETTAGGIPGWVTTLSGPLRTNSTEYDRSWKQYWFELIDLIVLNQIGLPNGTVIAVQIENEYITDANSSHGQPPGKDGYMQDLIDTLRDSGIVVPLTFNDAAMDRNYVTGMGSVDIYGFDSYPQAFNCSNPDHWQPVKETYASYQASLGLNSPLTIPEFQAGAFDPWGAVGYENCRKLTGPEFESVFYLNNLAANVKLISYYMVYGGTSWGYLPFPGVYTSYDYGAAISEDRFLNEKYTELKRQSFFLRSSEQFYQTEIISDSHQDPNYFGTDGADKAFVTELRNPSSGTGFYILRARNSTSRDTISFRLNVLTSKGPKELPWITLAPRRSKLLVTDYHTPAQSNNNGNSQPIRLLYTTSNVLLSAQIGGRQVLYLFSDDHSQSIEPSESSETSSIWMPSFETGHWIRSVANDSHSPTLQLSREASLDEYREMKWSVKDEAGILALGTDEAVILMTSGKMAGEVWNPSINSHGSKPPTSILIWGPWLVRNASLEANDSDGQNVLNIWGDLEEGIEKKVIVYVGGLVVESVKWNGKAIQNLMRPPGSDFLVFVCYPHSFKEAMEKKVGDGLIEVGSRIDLGEFQWTYRDSLPELEPNFVDDQWIEAKNEHSTNPYKKLYGKYYLYACDYGFCNGATIWRGHFTHTCEVSVTDQIELGYEPADTLGINMTISGGEAFAASVWLNKVFLGTVPGERKNSRKRSPKTVMGRFDFPTGSLKKCESNIITVVQDSMGMDETEGQFANTVKHPRGILGYKFEGEAAHEISDEIHWKVQGQLGGFHWLPDPDRGILNENGFYGIRSGWHLPSYDSRNSTEWKISSPIHDGLSSAGIGFYHTTIKLNFERGYDVMVSFQFRKAKKPGGRYRAEFWVNGWHMGKMISDLGPQMKFPVQEGILDYQGENDFGIAIWALEAQGARVGGLELVVDRILEGGIGQIEKSNPEYVFSRRHFPA